MPKASGARTGSVPNISKRVGFGLLAVVVLLVGFFGLKTRLNSRTSYDTKTISLNNYSVQLQIADTDAKREKGLGDRDSLKADNGMLFVFDHPAQECFWMKDMRFPLDIIWLDGAKRVTYVAANISPDTYPKAYCPSATAQYVIELNAGKAQAFGLHKGNRLRF